MKKKLLSLVFLAVAICLTLSVGMGFAYASSLEPKADEYYSNVNRSTELYRQVVSPYIIKTAKHNDKEFTVYSDDFAGVFIDEQGLLNIGIVASGSQIKSQQPASRHNGQVIYRQLTYSYNYLQKIMNSIENIMDDYSVNAVGIDDQFNHVFVELSDELNAERVVSYLQSVNLYDGKALNFSVDKNACIKQDADVAYGGESLFHWISSTMVSRGTICINAIDNQRAR